MAVDCSLIGWNPAADRGRCTRAVLFVVFMIGGLIGTVPVAHAASPAQVSQALKRGTEHLYKQQKPDGSWEQVKERNQKLKLPYSTDDGQWGGVTALATYALLASGESYADPRVAKAVAWLKNAEIIGNYALGMRCQVWLLLPPSAETRARASDDARRLAGGLDTTPRTKGYYLYHYLSTKKVLDGVDHSVSQFGVLGMWACAQNGVEVSDKYWDLVEKRWIFDQQGDGGWLYADKPNDSDHKGSQPSMTAAGVATLFITQDYVHAEDGINCKGNLRNEHIETGLKWMAAHTAEWTTSNFGAGYTLYGVERIGVASGLKYIGDVDWYQFGSDWCVKCQEGGGNWGNLPNTSLCMLFLARGRAPIVVNKLQYINADGPEKDKEGHWNQRPRDIANLVRWVGRQTEHDLNWQITKLDVPVADWHEAPILYIAGDEAPRLSDDQETKLKQFVEGGGMILVNADCGQNKPIVAGVTRLGKKLFPNYEFRELPEDTHPIYTSEQFSPKKWSSKPGMKGMSNGVRELILLLPTDPARNWQMQASVGPGKEESFQLADNILLYATDKNTLKFRGDSYIGKRDDAIKDQRSLKLARLKYDGNWDPEPGGWRRMATVLHNNQHCDLQVAAVELGKNGLGEYKAACLTGTTKFSLSAAQRDELKKFVAGGGLLVIDAAGGSSEFATAVETELSTVFGAPADAAIKTPIDPTDPLFKGIDVKFRTYAKGPYGTIGSMRSPQLRGIKQGDRIGVYYSRQDLSGGLVGQAIDGIDGYTPDTATALMRAILLQAAH